MSINQGINASLTEFIDKLLNLVEVSVIIDTRGSFDCLPHDSQSHEIETPLSELFYFSVSERELSIELFLTRDVGRNLIDYIHTMENDCSAILVSDLPGCWVNCD